MVESFPETLHQTRNNTDFPRPLRKSEARLCLACPPLARRNSAPHGGVLVARATPPFLLLVHHRRGLSGAYSGVRLPLPLWVAPSTVIPEGRQSSRSESRCRWLFRARPQRLVYSRLLFGLALRVDWSATALDHQVDGGKPLPERDGSTISVSGGQGRAVVWVATLQGWGGASRWCTRLATTKLHYQRAQPPPLWSRLFLEIRIGRGLARIPRVLCGKAP